MKVTEYSKRLALAIASAVAVLACAATLLFRAPYTDYRMSEIQTVDLIQQYATIIRYPESRAEKLEAFGAKDMAAFKERVDARVIEDEAAHDRMNRRSLFDAIVYCVSACIFLVMLTSLFRDALRVRRVGQDSLAV